MECNDGRKGPHNQTWCDNISKALIKTGEAKKTDGRYGKRSDKQKQNMGPAQHRAAEKRRNLLKP